MNILYKITFPLRLISVFKIQDLQWAARVYALNEKVE